MNIKSFLSRIYTTYYYNVFKKDPCKLCLVQPCCQTMCLNKHKWDMYTDRGRNKTAFQLFNLIMIMYGIVMIIFYISKLIMHMRL